MFLSKSAEINAPLFEKRRCERKKRRGEFNLMSEYLTYFKVSDGHCVSVDVSHFKFALLDGPLWDHKNFLLLLLVAHWGHLLNRHRSVLDHLLFGVFGRGDKGRDWLVLHEGLHHHGLLVLLRLTHHHLLLLSWTCGRNHNLLDYLAPLWRRLESTTLPYHLLLLPEKQLLLSTSCDRLPIIPGCILLWIYDQLLLHLV